MVPWQSKIRQVNKGIHIMVKTETSKRWDNSNGPDSPPVVFAGDNNLAHNYVDEAEERCRNCASTNLFTDWKQGDRVCTDCGVVAEEHLRDDRPEWKDFNDAEDLVKKGCTSVAASSARSGLVPVDERKYIGGLQPTTLSKQPFGGPTSGGYGLARIQKRLRTTNRRLDLLMEKQHKRELKDAKIDQAIRLKERQAHPERFHLLHEEHDDDDEIAKKHAALHNEKWSLDRAILLYGNNGQDDNALSTNNIEDREELKSRLDLSLQTASRDLYNAYASTTSAMQELDLPDKVRHEVLHRLVRYATQRDNLTVKGVSNRISKSDGGGGILQQSPAERKKLQQRLKDYNKRKQSSALGAALIHLTAKSMGHPRSINKICACFLPPPESTIGMDAAQLKKVKFVKGKHCSKAIQEIKSIFPEYVQSAAGAGANGVAEIPEAIWSPKQQATATATTHISESVDNFAQHFLKPLQLPPVAEASIQTLLLECRKEQIAQGNYSGVDMSTMCASIAYFCCNMGSIMQRLAQQVQEEEEQPQESSMVKKEESNGKKKRMLSDSDKAGPAAKKTKLSENVEDDSSSDDDSLDEFNLDSLTGNKVTTQQEDDDDDDVPFDVFSHAPIVEDQSEKQRYEMRRMWDAWKEQMPWARSVLEIEQSCGVTRAKITEFYSTELYPQREQLLQMLKEGSSSEGGNSTSALQNTPMARTLLDVVSTAGPLMSLKLTQSILRNQKNEHDGMNNAGFTRSQASEKTFEKYVPCRVEEYFRENAERLGFTKNSRPAPKGCNVWTDESATTKEIHDILIYFARELDGYLKAVQNFQQIPDLLKSIIETGNHDVCSTARLHPDGLLGLFPSKQLSLSKSGYIEPLTPPMRHHRMCFTGQLDMTLDYLIHDFEAMCRNLKPHSKRIFIDMGASMQFHKAEEGVQPVVQFLELFEKFGFNFDHIYGFEAQPLNTKIVFEGLPDKYFASYHWINTGVTDELGHKMNPLHSLLEKFEEDDFVIIKLDIDAASIELPLANQLLEGGKGGIYHRMIDQFYFEHHVHIREMARNWHMSGSIKDSLDLFYGLREKGIPAHFWP